MGLARHGDQKRAAVPVLPSRDPGKLHAIHQHLKSTDAEGHIEEVAEILLPQFAEMERSRGDKKCEQRCERMVLRPDALEIRKQSRLVSADREARERLTLVGSWPLVGWRYRALVVNEDKPRTDFNLDDMLKRRL